MTSDRERFEKTLHRHLGLFGSPSTGQLDASRGRIRERLRARYDVRPNDDAREIRASRASKAWRVGLVVATVAAAIVLMVTASRKRVDALGTIEMADGSRPVLRPNAVLRSSDAGSMLVLKDGSRLEMRANSELSLERAVDGIAVRLLTGGLIVTAAKQHGGHLYVLTKDMTVAVVGTMFVVNAESIGSRVTVIEGEVRVREGTSEKSVGPGQQVSTAPALATRSVREEVGWSRHADAILAAFAKGMTETGDAALVALGQAAADPEFEAASIKQCDPDRLPQTPDGGRGGGANSVQLTPGRLRALCVTPATLVRVAYGYRPFAQDFNIDVGPTKMAFGTVYGVGDEDGRRVRGGPDWMRSERYTVEAVAPTGSKPDAETLRGSMLKQLLERRLQLKTHIETEQAPAFALTVAKSGLKVKPAKPGACDELPARPVSTFMYGHPMSVLTPPRTLDDVRRGEKPSCGLWGHRNGPNQVMIAGDLPLAAILIPLGARLGGVRVLDRTGVTERFNFVLEFGIDENSPGLGFELPHRRTELDVAAAATIFTALEDQLGLKLERAQVGREFLVIDRIERPSSN